MNPNSILWRTAAAAAAIAVPATGSTQNVLDRGDAAVAAESVEAVAMPVERAAPPAPHAKLTAAPPAAVGAVEPSAITVDGAPTVPPAAFLPATEPFLGRPLGEADLKTLATSVANVLRERGFVFASAWIAPQTLAHGVLRVSVDEGRLDAVRLEGRDRPAVRRALGGLSDGQPVTGARLERALLLAGDLPGVDIVDSQYRTENGRGVLDVTPAVTPVEGYASVDNWGSRSAGPVRLRNRVALNDLLHAGDQLSLRTTLTPFDLRELATLGGDYSVVLGRRGTIANFGASYARVQPGGRYRRLDLDGRSVSGNIGLSHPVVRTAETNLWANLDLSLRDSEQDRDRALVRDDRVASVSFGLSGYALVAQGWLSGRVTFRQGLDVFGATERGDPLASRSNGGGVFSKAEAYAEWTVPVAPRVTVRFAGEGQVASRPLLSSEEFGIGGPRFGRGYDYSERRGDGGAAGSVELRYAIPGRAGPVEDLQLYGFVDGGAVHNIRGATGDDLFSAGGGLRFDLGRMFDAELEAGLPLNADRFETGDRNPRLSFTINARF